MREGEIKKRKALCSSILCQQQGRFATKAGCPNDR